MLLLGQEYQGIPEEVWDLLDEVVEIPMAGRGSSLNVAVAGSTSSQAHLNNCGRSRSHRSQGGGREGSVARTTRVDCTLDEERLQALRRIVLLIDDSLSPRGVGQWFRAHNRLLDGRRPLDELAQGEIDAVPRAAAAFAEGVYT